MLKNLVPVFLILLLEWQYPYPRAGIVFEVWGSPSISSPAWTLRGETSALSWTIDTTAPAGFFKVRARDTATGLVSDWATR
jgi:hypothetical protein